MKFSQISKDFVMNEFEKSKVKLYKLDANSAVHNANAQIKIYEKRLDEYDAKMIASRPLSKVLLKNKYLYDIITFNFIICK